MSSKPKRNVSTVPQATSTQAAGMGEALAGNLARDEEIKRRAYEIYIERGDNRAVSWLTARAAKP